ncbi:hypothetical protein HW555_005082 [Spodoptera exigua]|uniref:Uncharacterized protein n=1 Tax=Spodoptera exigua TaxID=7107 RepID=A0A835GL61_SPOEX|nr:hypothetical protein HW555_005082 [Spodoptera exigua]
MSRFYRSKKLISLCKEDERQESINGLAEELERESALLLLQPSVILPSNSEDQDTMGISSVLSEHPDNISTAGSEIIAINTEPIVVEKENISSNIPEEESLSETRKRKQNKNMRLLGKRYKGHKVKKVDDITKLEEILKSDRQLKEKPCNHGAEKKSDRSIAMPLSGAEKTRRYRERLKNERPDEYAAQIKRNLDRLKSKKKKISEMPTEEAEQQRKKWREEKRKSCAKKKQKQVKSANEPENTISDDVSRVTSGRKETRTQHKEKKQIRYLLDTLVESYKKYRDGGGRYGFTTFFNHKPFYVLSPRLNARDTCLCIKHSNLEFQHATLRRCGALKMGMREALSNVACNTKNYTCMYDKCELCKDKKLDFESPENSKPDDNNVSWLHWERQDHIYSKKEEAKTKEVKTKRTKKVTKSGKLQDLKNIFSEELHNFKKHHYNMQQQQSQYQKAISQLKDNEVVLVCDFSESYEAKLASEIQAMHFGASKNQITLHTGMVYWRDKTQSFCTIAESNNHHPPAIWAHLTPIIQLIKEETPNVNVIHFFSDGPSSQYRQKNNFFLLAHFAKELQLSFATWSFFESGHGKSVADGVGGSVKRALDRKVCQGFDVTDAKDAYDILKQCLKVTKVFLVPDSAITDINKILPKNIQILKGTLQVHQIMTQDENIIKFRDVSCFCEPFRGRCTCFQPQIHSVVSTTNRGGDRIQQNLQSSPKPPKPEQPKRPVLVDISLQQVINPIQIKHITGESFEDGSLGAASPLGTLNISDIESLKNLAMNINDSEEPVELMDIDVIPIIIAPEPKSTVGKRPGKENKSIKNWSSCNLLCQKCKSSIVGRKAKCMSCKKLYCEECTEGPTEWDYLCDTCLEGGIVVCVTLMAHPHMPGGTAGGQPGHAAGTCIFYLRHARLLVPAAVCLRLRYGVVVLSYSFK